MQLSGIDANLIVALRALLTHESVTRAAKDVGLSQSSMSHALARLRQHFGDPLLVQVGRKLVLTDRAKALRVPVASAVAQLERVFLPSDAFDPATSSRTFRIAATDNLALYVLPKLAALLAEEAPRVELRVTPLTEDWSAMLQRGEIDLKLGRKYPIPSQLEAEDLSHEEFGCVALRAHRVPARPSVRAFAALEHLRIAPSGSPSNDLAGAVDRVLAERGLRRHIAMTVPHFLVAPFIVASSDLVLTAPERLLDEFGERLQLRRIQLPFKVPGYTLSQVWSARTRDDEAQRWLRAGVARAFSTKTKHR